MRRPMDVVMIVLEWSLSVEVLIFAANGMM
jgi:hypothetical protein